MSDNRNEESNEFELEDFEDIEELNYEDDETEDDLLDDPRTRKLYEKVKADAEAAVVEELSKGDTDSPVYKGLQKVISKKDKELAETRMALSSLAQQIQMQGGATYEQQAVLETLSEAMSELLDEDGKAVLANRLNQRRQNQKMSAMEQTISNMLRQNQQGQQMVQQQQYYDEEEERIREYQRAATDKLRSFAKKMGADPNSKELDYGDENEPLFERMDKLERSIERVLENKDEDEIRRARRKLNPPSTRDDASVRRRESSPVGRSIIDRASNDMIQKMRKLNNI